MTESKHTPTPWHAPGLGEIHNADHIVRCVNNHDVLVEAIKRLLVCMDLAGWEGDDTAISARVALAKAEAA